MIYGNGETVHFSVDARSLKPLIYTPQSFLIEFDIEGKKEVGVMREVQYHPVTDQVLHADFFHVIPGKPISIDVPVKLTGNSEGVKQGGKLILSKRKVRISATMENLPDEIVVDVTTLGLGKSIFVGDLKYDHITILTPATTAICAVKMTRAAVAPPLQPKRPPRPRNSPEPHRFSYKYLAAEPPGNAARYFHLKQLRN